MENNDWHQSPTITLRNFELREAKDFGEASWILEFIFLYGYIDID